ncbi:MAG TPA: SMP-30/gluconolactonase/LRE family protein, partial [Bryobacteraceae bacterium]|nr:SMP-30/gluconolactonase/LRE family protein [Bryobacteraceae bacterium]
ARDGALWAGGEAGQIYRIHSNGVASEKAKLNGFCAGLAFAPDGSLYVCNSGMGIVKIRHDGSHEVFATEAAGKKLTAPNFGVFDAAGNYYVTDSGVWGREPGRIVKFNTDGTGVDLVSGLGYANGLTLSEDDRWLFLAESDTQRIYRIELNAQEDRPKKAEIYAEKVGPVPDGLALQQDGTLLVTSYASHSILAVSRERRVTVLAHDPNGILLGGPTNLCFDPRNPAHMYVANLNRWAISRARLDHAGVLPVYLRRMEQ